MPCLLSELTLHFLLLYLPKTSNRPRLPKENGFIFIHFTVVISREVSLARPYSSTSVVFAVPLFFNLPSFWRLHQFTITEAAHCRLCNDIRIYLRAAQHIFSAKSKDESREDVADKSNFGSFLNLLKLRLCYFEVKEVASLFALLRNNLLRS